MTPSNTVTTSFLLGNLHCPSCVAVIKNLLQEEFGDKVLWVSPNVVTSVVTVEHEGASAEFIRSMARTLEYVGFEICGVDTTAPISGSMDSLSLAEQGESSRDVPQSYGTFGIMFRLWLNKTPPGTPIASKAAAHLDNCEACKSATAHDQDHLSEDSVHLARDPSVAPRIQKPASSTPFKGITVDNGAPTPLLRATVSVGGMTCASCVNTITDEVQKNPWVARIVVNLVTNSATVDFTDLNRTQDIVDTIEDLGYDAVLDNVVDLHAQRQAADEREVEIKVDGIFCPRCPDRISQTLRNLGSSRISLLQEPSVQLPRLRIRYTPDAPRFTIRHILHAIEATDPSLQASIYHPPTLEERSRAIRAKHQRELLYREILTIIIAIPTFVLGIVYMNLVPDSSPTKHYLMKPWKSGLSRLEIILCVLATPVYFFAADVFHVRAIKELRTLWRGNSRTPLLERFYKFGSMNMLISLGTTIAYVSSVAQMIAAAAEGEMDVPEGRFYFDSVVFLTLFLLAGRLIEAYSKSKTGNAVEALAKLRPNTALLIEQNKLHGQTTTTIEIDRLERSDLIRIPHGASPAADGIIVIGETNFDESSLTGESRPIKKGPGDEVYAGTINKADAVTVRVTGTSGKSMLDQIVDVVREGQTKRAPVEQIADLLTSYFVPVITLIAIITWVVWMVLAYTGHVSDGELDSSGGQAAFAFQFAIAVFVVACPCGLALAAPTAIFVGGGIAAKNGILAKGGGEAFEKASKIDCVVFDKTGTLTVGGEPQITDSAVFPDGEIEGVDRRTLLSGLKAVEESSSHPIGKAIVAFCGPEIHAAELGQVEEVPGKGMKATFKAWALDLAVGNEHLMRDLSAPLSQHVVALLQGWKAEAKSVALVATRPRDGKSWKLAAILSISDAIRPESAAVIKALQNRGTQVWMLSGDNVTTAQAVAQCIGIPSSNVLAEVLPSEKAAKITYLQATVHASSTSAQRRIRRLRHEYTTRRAMVAMVGDGINDSPALTTADVGIAIGSGSDVAISSADFVLATSSLSAVLTLLDLSRTVFRRIKVNFAWALVYNMLAVPIAAGCLYAVRTSSGAHVRLDPVWAALAMALSSISVVLSSLSLRLRLPWVGFRHSPVVVADS
ncbi:putative copper-transporting ATPase HMA5 [Tolypocladium ophioglossoides CBS 100239]|uniref:Putative copper-transporting ATPase HMA5 n=1 Tax=Tolypocladium ophioglossoides (strain CBS 100239) TaxID=1163406 RepID=A0A0L0N9C5_TOLOC|nr:putative copper-transporting ATPase HMA5 [Tolypocladium ophioglossoides CBS 100239]